ncbi:hypothetical protein GE061_008908 [Apolygus lucorum]|uniref:Peptidase S1 domain-containing protein n=1 Tax=Apolygus lucorum TaxID=248454 RepID=A0A8S9Y068_APOLU|nr:hypothetical protein GE061_008908 [Apolygus lucorum]
MRRRSSDTTWSLLVLFSIHIVLCVGQRSGQPAKPGDYPYLLTVLNHGRGICAATLFTTTLAITACHCLLKDASGVFKAPHDLLETGRMELDSGNEGQHPTGQPRFVKVIKVHPKCESTQRSMVYDFGLIEVTEPFELKNGYTEILNFLEPADDKPKDCYGLEFQTVERDGKPWDISTMQIRKLAVTNDEICAGLFKYYHRKLEFRPDLQFCAGIQDEDADKTFFCGLPDYGSPVPKPFPPFVPDYDPDMPSTIVPGCWIDDGGPHSFDVYPLRYSTLPFLIHITVAQVRVNPADYPFMGTLLWKRRGICGAVLYTTNHLITACRCLAEDPSAYFDPPPKLKKTSTIEVDMGSDGPRPSGQSRRAIEIKVHPKCESSNKTMFYDYGIIQVAKPFEIRDRF